MIMKKKVVSVMLCAAMTAAVLAGCGSSSAETVSEDTSAAAEETEDAAAEETAETAEADTEESAGGTLVMGTNAEFPPYEYYEGQEVVGIDAEMAAAVAEKLRMELKIEDMAFDSLIPALSSGKVDIVAAGMTVTEDRLASVNFSDTYATGIQAIIVTEDSDIASADDLVGKTIGVQQGTTGDLYATDVEGATIERYAKGMEAVQSLSQGKIDAVIIASVVPDIMHSLTSGVIKYLHTTPVIVTPESDTGIRVNTENPSRTGPDRIVNAVAGYEIAKGPAIVIDFGTATTYDLIGPDGTLEACIIAPGIETAGRSLWGGAAMLPAIQIEKPDTILARDTIAGMQGGLVFGAIGQTEYIVRKMKEESGYADAYVIATGGLGKIIAKETECIDLYEPRLTLNGLRLIYERIAQ